MDDPRRILLVRLSHLGDVTQALPCFHALRARFPRAHLAWAVESRFAGLLDGLAGLDRVVLFDRHGGPGAWFRLRRELRDLAPDLTVDVQGNWKSAVVARLSGARRRVAPAPSEWRERSAARLANACAPPTPVPVHASVPHAVDRVLHVTEHLCGAFAPRRDPALTDAERAAARERLEGVAPSDGAPLVLVQVSPANDVRTATDACLVDATSRLIAAGVRPLLIGAASERERALCLADAVARASGADAPAVNCDALALRAFAAQLAAAAERDAVLLTGDTGPLHLGAAVGLTCVCLSGPFDPARTGPWPTPADPRSPHAVLGAAIELECRPCASRTCRRPGGRVCLDDLDGARVAAVVLERLAAARDVQAPNDVPSTSSSSAMRSGTSR